MKLSTYSILVAILSLFFGLQLLIIPLKLVEFYGIKFDAGSIQIARSLGACFCLLGLICWALRDFPVTSPVWRSLLLLFLIFDLVEIAISLMAVLNGQINSMGWSIVVIYVLYAIGSVYYLSQSKKPVPA